MKHVYLLVFFVLFAAGKLIGQPYYFSHYQVESGLSSNSVMCSLQDKRGFLWFGTKDGLNSFNGYQFKVFRNDPDVPGSIGGNFIHSLWEDPQGKIWVGTDRGVFSYNAETESFTKLRVSPTDEIRDIKTDRFQNLWFIAGYTLYRYHQPTGKLKIYSIQNDFEASSLCLNEGNLWVSTAGGSVKEYDAKTNTFRGYSVFDNSRPAITRFIERLYNSGKGYLFIGTAKQGVKLFDLRKHTYKDLPLLNEDKTEIFARAFVNSGGNEYWIGTESGIFIYSLGTDSFTRLKKQYNDSYSLSDNAIYTFCKDTEGGIWTGTYFGGINYYSKQYSAFQKYFPKVGENSISGNAVREIHEDANKNLWIGTEDGGLNRMDTTGHFTSFKASGLPGGIANNNIHGMLVTGDSIWVGTFENGLDIFRISTGKVIRHYISGGAPNMLKSNFIYTIYRTRARNIYLGATSGLYRYNYATKDFTRQEEVPPYFYTQIFEDSRGYIWAGTYTNGLFYFKPGTHIQGKLRYRKKKDASLDNDRINTIYEDDGHNIWFGTERGLYKLDSRRQLLKKYSIKNGFPSDVVFAILPDEDKKLWISTSKGLVRFDPVNGSIKTYTKANGLLSDQFNYNSAYKDSSGRMYFGSVKGMISFMPFKPKVSYTSPNYITAFQVDNRELAIGKNKSPLKKSISFTDTVKLRYNQSSFSIDFAALSYTSPEMTAYRYKMEGLDEHWTVLNSNRKVYFTGLNPGLYTFKFESSNYTGMWSRHPKTLVIVITSPFWASGWAYVVYFMLIVTGIILFMMSYHKRSEARNRRKISIINTEKEKEIYESKIAFFTNVAHEIRTPLTLIIGPMERVMKASGEIPSVKTNLRIMERNTNRLLELTNQLLDFRKTEINGYKLNFVKSDVVKLLTDTYSRFKGYTQQKKIRYHLETPPTKVIAYVDREALDKILSNLIDNAVKYAKSKVTIIILPLAEGDQNFTILIKNDGHLIPAEKKNEIFETFYRLKVTEKLSGTGIGLPLSRSLAELHNGTIELLDAESDMNVFRLVLPVHQQMEFNIT